MRLPYDRPQRLYTFIVGAVRGHSNARVRHVAVAALGNLHANSKYQIQWVGRTQFDDTTEEIEIEKQKKNKMKQEEEQDEKKKKEKKNDKGKRKKKSQKSQKSHNKEKNGLGLSSSSSSMEEEENEKELQRNRIDITTSGFLYCSQNRRPTGAESLDMRKAVSALLNCVRDETDGTVLSSGLRVLSDYLHNRFLLDEVNLDELCTELCQLVSHRVHMPNEHRQPLSDEDEDDNMQISEMREVYEKSLSSSKRALADRTRSALFWPASNGHANLRRPTPPLIPSTISPTTKTTTTDTDRSMPLLPTLPTPVPSVRRSKDDIRVGSKARRNSRQLMSTFSSNRNNTLKKHINHNKHTSIFTPGM